MSVHFCTFGSMPTYGPALARIGKQAQDSKYFESVNCFTQNNTPGLAAHADFIAKSPKGYGYWIWKPLIILETMRKAQENDVIVYADAGCYINSTPEAKRKFEIYLSLVKKNAPHRINFQLSYPEEMYTKNDVLSYFQAMGTEHATSRQIAGTYMILVNTPENRAIMEELHQIMGSDNHHLHDDSPSRIPNAPSFIDHRHDQSVLSVLMKMRGTLLVEDVYPPKDTDPISPMRSRRA
jgi:hypothetical protein